MRNEVLAVFVTVAMLGCGSVGGSKNGPPPDIPDDN